MIALMNYAIPLILLVGVFVGYKLNSFYPLAFSLAIAVLYTVAQPTYLPKGTVAAPVVHELEYIDKPIVDRGRKVMSDEQRDAQRNEQLKQINDSIESKIEKGE